MGFFTHSHNNKLKSWIVTKGADEVKVMNLLQEYGVISDNCVLAGEVGNDMEAMKWMACNHWMLPQPSL